MNENLVNSCLQGENFVKQNWSEKDWEYFQTRFKALSEPKKVFIHKPMKRGPKKPYKYLKKRLNLLSEPRYVLVKTNSHNYRFIRNVKQINNPYNCTCRPIKKYSKIDEDIYKKLSKPKVQNKKYCESLLCKSSLSDPITPVSENAKHYVPSVKILQLSKPIIRKNPPVPKVCSRYYIKRSALKYKANERIKNLAIPRPHFLATLDPSLEYKIPNQKRKIHNVKRLKMLAMPKLTYERPTKVCVCSDNIKSFKNTSSIDKCEVNKIVNNRKNAKQYYDILCIDKTKKALEE